MGPCISKNEKKVEKPQAPSKNELTNKIKIGLK